MFFRVPKRWDHCGERLDSAGKNSYLKARMSAPSSLHRFVAGVRFSLTSGASQSTPLPSSHEMHLPLSLNGNTPLLMTCTCVVLYQQLKRWASSPDLFLLHEFRYHVIYPTDISVHPHQGLQTTQPDPMFPSHQGMAPHLLKLSWESYGFLSHIMPSPGQCTVCLESARSSSHLHCHQ